MEKESKVIYRLPSRFSRFNNNSLIVFDFDGTIADSMKTGADLINSYADKFGYKKIDFASFEEIDAKKLIRLSGVKFRQIPKFLKFFRSQMNKLIDTVLPDESILELIKLLNHNNINMGIVSTNSYENIDFFMRKFFPDVKLQFIKSDVAIFGKTRALKKIKRRLRNRYNDFVYIGDELRDERAAANAGYDFFFAKEFF